MVITETPQQKLLYIAKQLGLKSLAGMQGTTRAIYDTIDQPATGPSTLTFFDNVGQRAAPLTNLADNQFQVGEALAIEAVQIGFASGEQPFFFQSNFVDPVVLSIKIGNQTVLKKVPLGNAFANLTGISTGAFAVTQKVWFNVPLIIPPQVRFTAELENVPSTALQNPRIFCAFYGTGVLLNLKQSL